MATSKPEKKPPARPGHVLIFRQTITLKNGRVIRRADGRPFPIWVKVA